MPVLKLACHKKIAFTLLLTLMVFYSCNDKMPEPNSYGSICIGVKDYFTNNPIQHATVVMSCAEVPPFFESKTLEGQSDINGYVCFNNLPYEFMRALRITANDYEIFTDDSLYASVKYFINLPDTVNYYMVKRNANIQFHLINQLPAFIEDSLLLTMATAGSGTSGINQFKILPGGSTDTTITLTAASGNNTVKWKLYRSNTLINEVDSNVFIAEYDTAFVNIEY